MKKIMFTLGCLSLVVWFFGGIIPYILHYSDWNSWQAGESANWVSDSVFWEIYYGFGILGGWEFLLIFGMFCCWHVLSKTLQTVKWVVLSAVLFSLILSVSIIFTGNGIRTILLVLE